MGAEEFKACQDSVRGDLAAVVPVPIVDDFAARDGPADQAGLTEDLARAVPAEHDGPAVSHQLSRELPVAGAVEAVGPQRVHHARITRQPCGPDNGGFQPDTTRQQILDAGQFLLLQRQYRPVPVHGRTGARGDTSCDLTRHTGSFALWGPVIGCVALAHDLLIGPARENPPGHFPKFFSAPA
ncbi:hypothetical protein ACFYW6_23850 [Streptomyces sp. NPDC002659]|uniref:hypothetical protein n=1 Tax=Streptomyces sp. NPDC002659 TaxID=3364656 RepID=UPI003679E6FA